MQQRILKRSVSQTWREEATLQVHIQVTFKAEEEVTSEEVKEKFKVAYQFSVTIEILFQIQKSFQKEV